MLLSTYALISSFSRSLTQRKFISVFPLSLKPEPFPPSTSKKPFMCKEKVREILYFLNFSYYSPLMGTNDRPNENFNKVQDDEFKGLSYRT